MLSPVGDISWWEGSQIWATRTSVLALAVALTVWLHLGVLSLRVLIHKIGRVFVIKFDNSVK